MSRSDLTERQKKWFATVLANLEKDTGRSLEQWPAVMETCPETAPRAQAAWLKTGFGVGANHAARILDACQPPDAPGWDEPAALRAALWKDAGALAILEAVERIAGTHADVISGQRKSYTSFSRSVQFAAMRPLKGGKALLGLKLDPAESSRLSPSIRRESWSERLTAVVELAGPAEIDAGIAALFRAASKNG